jgi:hypothetical protein
MKRENFWAMADEYAYPQEDSIYQSKRYQAATPHFQRADDNAFHPRNFVISFTA